MSTETTPKLCKDCTHLAKSSVGDALSWKCMAQQNIIARELDLVTGETRVKRRWLTCYEARGSYADGTIKSCGPSGEWFEPAPPKFIEPAVSSTISYSRKAPIVDDLLSQLDSMK